MALALVETEEERQSRHEAYLKRVEEVSLQPQSPKYKYKGHF
jgi:hypothetical protein